MCVLFVVSLENISVHLSQEYLKQFQPGQGGVLVHHMFL